MTNPRYKARKHLQGVIAKAFTEKDQKRIERDQDDIAELFGDFMQTMFQNAHRQSIKQVIKTVKKQKDIELEDLLHHVYSQTFEQLRDILMEGVEDKLIQDAFMLGFAIGGLAGSGMDIPDSTPFTEGGKA